MFYTMILVGVFSLVLSDSSFAQIGFSGGRAGVVTDIRDGEGDSLLDPTTNTLRTTMGTHGPGENATSKALTEIYASDSGFPVRYTTTGDKSVKATFGELVGVMVWSGTSVTLTFYDDADGTCNSSQISGTFTPTVGRYEKLPFRFASGICMVVAGTSPDLTVVYK